MGGKKKIHLFPNIFLDVEKILYKKNILTRRYVPRVVYEKNRMDCQLGLKLKIREVICLKKAMKPTFCAPEKMGIKERMDW